VYKYTAPSMQSKPIRDEHGTSMVGGEYALGMAKLFTCSASYQDLVDVLVCCGSCKESY
jgi:hypothetical protein